MSNNTTRPPASRRDKPSQDAIRKARADVQTGRKRPSEAATELLAAEQYTMADAQLDTAAGAQAKVEYELREATARVARAKASYDRAKADRDRLVARSVTSRPDTITWYDHPGPLDRHKVQDAAGLTTMALHRLMERYRGALERKRR